LSTPSESRSGAASRIDLEFPSVEPAPRFFWLHLKKCGGMSFRKTFSPPYVETDRTRPPRPFSEMPRAEWNDCVNNYRTPLGEYDYRRMLFVRDRLYSPAEFDAMYKFAFSRNPYDRVLSAWRFLYRKRWYHPLRYSFPRFLRALPSIWATKSDRHVATHTAPIWPDVADDDGRLLLDDLFHLEEIDRATPILNERLGTNVDGLAHTNRMSSASDYRAAYTTETRRLVEQLYAEDLERLAYRF
jgi:hypothetical protein